MRISRFPREKGPRRGEGSPGVIFAGAGLLLLVVMPVKPLANIVADDTRNNTRSDRQQEICEDNHGFHLLSVARLEKGRQHLQYTEFDRFCKQRNLQIPFKIGVVAI